MRQNRHQPGLPELVERIGAVGRNVHERELEQNEGRSVEPEEGVVELRMRNVQHHLESSREFEPGKLSGCQLLKCHPTHLDFLEVPVEHPAVYHRCGDVGRRDYPRYAVRHHCLESSARFVDVGSAIINSGHQMTMK